jgi:formate hydrogenlyase subunit 6/NADH:ubiquinone oxidoreductase subunit I
LCEQVCPDECIHIVSEKKPEGKGKRLVSFEINYERCCFCGLCVDPCPTTPLTAIYMSHDYELADYRREGFVAPLKALLDGNAPKRYEE